MSRSLLVDQGPLSNRPVAGAGGRSWWDTEEGKLYYDDGVEWSEVGAGQAPSGGESSAVIADGVARIFVGGDIANVSDHYIESMDAWGADVLAPHPHGRWRMSFATTPEGAAGSLHTFGGRRGSSEYGTRHEIYDVDTDTWTTLTTATISQASLGAAVLGPNQEFIYKGGGLSSSVFNKYELTTDTYTALSQMPAVRYYHSYVLVNNGQEIIALGGVDSGGVQIDTIWTFSIEFNAWSSSGRALASFKHLGSQQMVQYGGLIYMLGGDRNQASSEVYDPGADTWTTLAPEPTPVDQATCFVAGNYLWLASGTSSASNGAAVLQRYDPASDSWSTAVQQPPEGWRAASVAY